MAKAILAAALDVALATFQGDACHVCSAQPTTYTEAATTFKLATQTITGGNYSAANGDTSGRKQTLTPPAGTSITASGTATHVATTVGTTLKVVTTCTSQALTSGGSVNIGAFAHELRDPT